jgi:hypothetical protein
MKIGHRRHASQGITTIWRLSGFVVIFVALAANTLPQLMQRSDADPRTKAPGRGNRQGVPLPGNDIHSGISGT